MDTEKYYAVDNEEFDTLQELVDYEAKLEALFDSVSFFDWRKRKIRLSLSNYEDCVDTYYLRIKDVEESKKLFVWLRNFSRFDPEVEDVEYKSGDVLAWDELSNSWYNVNNRIKQDTMLLQDLSD